MSEQRAIDANALFKQFLLNVNGERIPEVDCDNFPVTVPIATIKQMIRKAPTIEKRGEWIIRHDGPYGRTRAYCSYCEKHSGIGGIVSNQKKPYCPNCGAKMLEGEK